MITLTPIPTPTPLPAAKKIDTPEKAVTAVLDHL
jgi:hypothetical protein